MKAISLSQRLHALVDDDVWAWLHFWNWSVTRANKATWYARRRMKHPTSNKDMFIYLHRLIAGITKDGIISFRDSNPLNLQRENLKLMDYKRNEIVWDGSRGESIFTGVSWDKYYGLWRAHLKDLPIGYYVAEMDAAEAYNKAAKEIMRDRADLNNMDAVWAKK